MTFHLDILSFIFGAVITVKCPPNLGTREVASTGLFAIQLPISPTELGQIIKAPILSCLKYPANGVIPPFTVNLIQSVETPNGVVSRESKHIYIQFQEVGDSRDSPVGMEIQMSGWLE